MKLAHVTGLVFFAMIATASAQSTIHGIVNLAGPGATFRSFQMESSDPLGTWEMNDTSTSLYYGLDYDAAGTTLWAMSSPSRQYGTYDVVEGDFTPVGFSNLPAGELRSLKAHPDGTTWYAMTSPSGSAESQLWRTVSGFENFARVGPTMIGDRFWTLACALDGSLYATSVYTDSLYSIDPVTGSVSLVGPLGFDLNYMQDMDFDWSTGQLLATISGLAGVYLAELDTANGTALLLGDISVVASQAVMTVATAAPRVIEITCDPGLPNSSGLPTKITGDWSSPTATGLHLDGHFGPSLQFGFFLVGTGYSGVGVIISEGRLCLSTAVGDQIGRFTLMGTSSNSIGYFDATGEFVNMSGTSASGYGFDVPETASIMGAPPFTVGTTWHFQLWHRDGPGAANLSNAASVTF